MFNRRALQRGVVATSGVGLEAEVMPSEVTERNMRSYAVGVRNISIVGISLRLSASVHQALSSHDELSLALRLPGRVVRRIACHVRHRLYQNSDFVYGCEYNWNETMDRHTAAEDLLFAAEQTRTRDLSTRLQRDLRRLGATVAFAGEANAIQLVLSEMQLARSGRSGMRGGAR